MIKFSKIEDLNIVKRNLRLFWFLDLSTYRDYNLGDHFAFGISIGRYELLFRFNRWQDIKVDQITYDA